LFVGSHYKNEDFVIPQIIINQQIEKLIHIKYNFLKWLQMPF